MCIIEDITGKQDDEDMIVLNSDEHAIIIYLQDAFHCKHKYSDGTHMCVMTERFPDNCTNSTVFAFRRDIKKADKYILNVKIVFTDVVKPNGNDRSSSKTILTRSGVDRKELIQAINTLYEK